MSRTSADPDDYCDICHGPCCGHGNIPVDSDPVTNNPYTENPYDNDKYY